MIIILAGKYIAKIWNLLNQGWQQFQNCIVTLHAFGTADAGHGEHKAALPANPQPFVQPRSIGFLNGCEKGIKRVV